MRTVVRKRERDIIVGRIDEVPDSKPGLPICIRPFLSDDKKLDEIVKETGEGKSALVRRMIRFALSDKRESFAADRCQGKLEWLIKDGRKKDDVSSDMGRKLDDILERIGGLESEIRTVAEISHQVPIFLREIYCMTSILISSQNLSFTRLLEFASPDSKEREQAVLIAAAAMANQIGQAVKDLNKFAVFHNIRSDDDASEDLYLLTKIKVIKDLINASSSAPKQTRTSE